MNSPPGAFHAALLAVSRLATRAAEPHEVADQALHVIADTLQAETGLLALVDPNDTTLELVAVRGVATSLLRRKLQMRQGLLGWTAYQRRPALAPDALSDWRCANGPERLAVEMACPMEDDGQLVGVISLGRRTGNPWGPPDLDMFAALVAEATRVVQVCYHMRQLRTKAGQLSVLIDIGQRLVARVDQKDLLEIVARDALRLTGCQSASVLLVGGDRDVLAPAVALGFEPAPNDGQPYPLRDTLAGTVVQTRKQLEVPVVLSQDYFECLDVPRGQPVRSLLATPMIAENEVIGTLTLHSEETRRFANDEKRLLLALASLAAVAVRNVRLYARTFEAEETLQRHEKLTTLGLLAAEIAHEIRNPLTVLKLLFGSLGLEFPPEDPRRKDVEIIRDKMDQLEGIVGRVLSFGRSSGAMFSRWSLGELIADTLLLVRHKLRQSQVEAVYEPPEHPVWVEANRGQIQQVLLNLVINAVQAMPQGGRLVLRCRAAGELPAPRAIVEIEDSGHGIPEGIAPRIFDSFLSGRPDGTGLGLAITRRILLSHRGDIEVARTGPDGTLMRFRLPLAG